MRGAPLRQTRTSWGGRSSIIAAGLKEVGSASSAMQPDPTSCPRSASLPWPLEQYL